MFSWLGKSGSKKKTASEAKDYSDQSRVSNNQSAINEWEALKQLGNTYSNNGRIKDASECYRRAIELNPRYAEAHVNLGSIFYAQGHVEEAVALFRKAVLFKPDLFQAQQNLGIALMNLGQNDAAEECFRQVIALAPGNFSAMQCLGVIAAERGDLSLAEIMLRRALELNPDYAEAHVNLGSLLMLTQRVPEAEASCRRALELNPDYAEAYFNLGCALKDLGQLEDAAASFSHALKIQPNFVDAHCNLGIALKEMNQLAEAETSFRLALQLRPDSPVALKNLAWLLNAQGKPEAALNIIKLSLRTSDSIEAKNIFVACVRQLRFTDEDREIRAAMVRALTEPWGRPNELAGSSTALVKLNPVIEGCVARAVCSWPVRIPGSDLFGSNGLAAADADLLLCAMLKSAVNCDIPMERFLTMARRALLETASGMEHSNDRADTGLEFYSALACQCFINEYVFSHTEEEIQKASALRDSLEVALRTQSRVPDLSVIALAAYFPLGSLPYAAHLLEMPWSGEVDAILTQQIREPEEERQLRATIPQLTDFDNDVSLLVRDQYEENPYPRWIKLAPAGKGKTIIEHLSQRFPLAPIKRYNKTGTSDILVAGCGTGQQPIEIAHAFTNSRVLAVDLSKSSLSYAKRKTRECGLTSIDYAQADLLKLGSLDRKFDLILSSGVLHHLADPWAGWRVLVSLLRPGGFMMLAFYSEVARRNIVKARALISEHGYGSSADDIRRWRQKFMELSKSVDFGTTLRASDFFSTSDCRDLLFHVQEHRMTLPGISSFLRENHLTFLGFEIDDDILLTYKRRFPDDAAATNLEQWQIFEHENPDTFFNMYNFWVQKDD